MDTYIKGDLEVYVSQAEPHDWFDAEVWEQFPVAVRRIGRDYTEHDPYGLFGELEEWTEFKDMTEEEQEATANWQGYAPECPGVHVEAGEFEAIISYGFGKAIGREDMTPEDYEREARSLIDDYRRWAEGYVYHIDVFNTVNNDSGQINFITFEYDFPTAEEVWEYANDQLPDMVADATAQLALFGEPATPAMA